MLLTAVVSRHPGGACPHMHSCPKLMHACKRLHYTLAQLLGVLQTSAAVPVAASCMARWCRLPPLKPKRLDNNIQMLTRHDPMRTPMLRGVQPKGWS